MERTEEEEEGSRDSQKLSFQFRKMSARLSAFAALNYSDSESDRETNDNDNANRASTSENGTPVTETGGMAFDLGLGGSSIYVNGAATTNQFVPVLHSNFSLAPGQNVLFGEHTQIVGLMPGNVLVVKGRYRVSALVGAASVDAFVVAAGTAGQLVDASNLASLPCIRAVAGTPADHSFPGLGASPFACVVQLASHDDNMDGLPLLYPHLRYLYACEHSKNSWSHHGHKYTFSVLVEAEPNRVATSVPDSWAYQLDRLALSLAVAERKNRVVLIVGNKNTGKSSFLKLLANTLLSSANTITSAGVQVLDMDPGQPELCLSGCISLSTITSPLLGTVQSFRVEKCAEVVKYLGFNSPNIQPLNYLRQLDQLINEVSTSKNTITLINSPGWVKGFGAEIVSHLNTNLDITSLIQLSDELRDLDIIREIPWNRETEIIRLPAANRSTHSFNTYSPLIIRNAKLLSYMHYDAMSEKFNFNPLLLKSPYRLSYLTPTSDVRKMRSFNGIIGVSIFDSQGVAIADVPQSLECQYVALVTISAEKLFDMGGQDAKPSSSFPNCIHESFIHSVPNTFHGLAIVHSVDTRNETINIYTPINTVALAEKLASGKEKLLLVKGRGEVPMDEIYSTQLIKGSAMYWNNFGLSCPPYVNASLNNDVIGGKTVGIRRNIQRR